MFLISETAPGTSKDPTLIKTLKLIVVPVPTSVPKVIRTIDCTNLLSNPINATAAFFDTATAEWYLLAVAGRLYSESDKEKIGIALFGLSSPKAPLTLSLSSVAQRSTDVKCIASFPVNAPGFANRIAVGFGDGSVGVLVVTIAPSKRTAMIDLKPHITQPDGSASTASLQSSAEKSTSHITSIDVYYEDSLEAPAEGQGDFLPSTPANPLYDDSNASGKVLRILASTDDGRLRVYDPDGGRLLRLTRDRASPVTSAVAFKNRHSVARSLRWANRNEKMLYEWETAQQGTQSTARGAKAYSDLIIPAQVCSIHFIHYKIPALV